MLLPGGSDTMLHSALHKENYMFSKRITSITPSPIRRFAPLQEEALKKGKTIIPLNIGQPDILTPGKYYDAIAAQQRGVLAYCPSNGIDELLEGFKTYYDRYHMGFEKKDILITSGGSEALQYTFMCLCDSGDEILVFEPYYANYDVIATSVDVTIVPATTKREENFAIPPKEAILEKISPRTRAITVTNPNNPTGTVLTREEVERIIEVALEKDLFIISDEVYREFIYTDDEFISFTDYDEIKERLIIIDSVSKRFSACGARIGCIASKNKEFIQQALKLCQARLCVAYTEQIGAAAMLKNIDEDYIRACVEEYRARRDFIYKRLNEIDGVSCDLPAGAFYLIAKLPVEDSEDFTGWMLTDFDEQGKTLMLCPASGFYATKGLGKNEIRISYVLSVDKLKMAMDVLEAGLKAYKNR